LAADAGERCVAINGRHSDVARRSSETIRDGECHLVAAIGHPVRTSWQGVRTGAASALTGGVAASAVMRIGSRKRPGEGISRAARDRGAVCRGDGKSIVTFENKAGREKDVFHQRVVFGGVKEIEPSRISTRSRG